LIAALASVAAFAQEKEAPKERSRRKSSPGRGRIGRQVHRLEVGQLQLRAIGLGYLMAKSLPTFFAGRSDSIRKGIAVARAATTEARVAKLGAEIEAFRNEAKAEMQRENDRI
jgi:hypothetical protein